MLFVRLSLIYESSIELNEKKWISRFSTMLFHLRLEKAEVKIRQSMTKFDQLMDRLLNMFPRKLY